MVSVMALFVTLLLCWPAMLNGQQDGDNACIEKPCGPFICKARCVASCLDADLAPAVAECTDRFCGDYNDDKPCSINDTACWKTCGFQSPPEESPPPPTMPDDLLLDTWASGFSSANADQRAIHITWPATIGANLYIVEAFPMFGTDPKTNNQHVIKVMITEPSFSFDRADLCNVYMVRVIAVNAFGISPPRYLVVDAWKPELHFDENFDVQYIRREDDYVKVRIDFTPPESWNRVIVEFENSLVHAYDCLGPMDDTLFLRTQPDEDGYLTPMVFINATGSVIELSFPAKLMSSKCLYSFKVLSLRSCNSTIVLDEKTAGGVNFALNCMSVENSNCETSDSETDSNQNNTSSGQSEEAVVVADPEAIKELQMEKTTLASAAANDSKEIIAKGDSKEVAIALNGDPLKELHQEPTTTAVTESGEIAVVGLPEAMKELQEGTVSPSETTVESGSYDDHPGPSPPSPLGDGGAAPVIVIIEPRDPKAPICKLAEFDAQLDFKTDADSKVAQPTALSIAWMEDRPTDLSANPSRFLIRYGLVARTLIVESQPDIADATITSVPDVDSPSKELTRVFKITNLVPNGLYAFQICAIFTPSFDPSIAWDMMPRYLVDVSAANDDPSSATSDSADNSTSDDYRFADAFINALNNTFNKDETADSVVTIAQNSNEDGPDEMTTTPVPDEMTTTAAQDQASSDDQSKESSNAGILEIILPAQRPPVFNIDVKPILVTESNSWPIGRALWFILALALLTVTVSVFMMVILRRRRNWRGQKIQQFQAAPIYHTASVPTVAADVKIPIP